MIVEDFVQKLFHPKDVRNQINQSHRLEVMTLLYIRVIILVYMTCVIIQTDVQGDDITINFLYLTLWGAFVSYAYFICAVIENVSYLINERNQFFHDALWQVSHMLFTIAFCLELPICLMFWGYIYPQYDINGVGLLIYNINVHGGFFLCVLIDEFVNDIEFITSHLFVILAVGIAYSTVNLTYVLTSGKVIYPGITWTNTVSYVVGVMTSAVIILAFCLGKFIHKKLKHEKIKQRMDSLMENQSNEARDVLRT